MCLQESLAYWILPIFLRWLLDVIYWKFLNKLSHCTPAHTTWSVFFKYLSFEKWQSYKTLCLKNRKGTVSGQSFYARHKWFYLFSFYLILLLLSSPTPMDPFVIHTKILARRSHHQTAFTSLPTPTTTPSFYTSVLVPVLHFHSTYILSSFTSPNISHSGLLIQPPWSTQVLSASHCPPPATIAIHDHLCFYPPYRITTPRI